MVTKIFWGKNCGNCTGAWNWWLAVHLGAWSKIAIESLAK